MKKIKADGKVPNEAEVKRAIAHFCLPQNMPTRPRAPFPATTEATFVFHGVV